MPWWGWALTGLLQYAFITGAVVGVVAHWDEHQNKGDPVPGLFWAALFLWPLTLPLAAVLSIPMVVFVTAAGVVRQVREESTK